MEEQYFSDPSSGSADTITWHFLQQVGKTPEHIAVEFGTAAITYRRLDEMTTELAACLSRLGVKEESLVPLFIERSVEMVIAILAVLKAGAAYVPLDPRHPAQRISQQLNDTRSPIVLTTSRTNDLLAKGNFECIPVDNYPGKEEQRPASAKTLSVKAEQLAYVIYTSGSTGTPKGVMVEHRNVMNLIHAQTAVFNIVATDKILLFSNYCFDASVEQIFLALLNGARLVMFPEGLQLKAKEFERFIVEKGITHLHATPGFLATLTSFNFPCLKRIVAGGEVCSIELAARASEYTSFYNEYGPTETSVTATEYHCKTGEAAHMDVMPIGKPLPNYFVYILNGQGQPVPDGIAGDIYIGGAGVTRGYLNQPTLTSEVFKTDPFNKTPGARMYCTGDTGKRLPDGNILFLGRKDDQVKIRGYRIEPEEIAAVLRKNQRVKQAVVFAEKRTPDDIRLVAFAAVDLPKPGDSDLLLDHLRKTLPDYMIPSEVYILESLPLTVNGKVDKAALLNLVPAKGNATELSSSVRDETEEKLMVIWKQLLGTDQISTKETFFKLGGHSLLLIKLSLQVNDQFGLEIPPHIFFDDPTIEKLALFIKNNRNGNLKTVNEDNPFDERTVTPAQRQLFLANRLKPSGSFPNSSITYCIDGTIEEEMIEAALVKIIVKNESLRVSYRYENGQVLDRISDIIKFKLIKIHAGGEDIDDEVNELIKAFDLSQAPLIRVFLIVMLSGKKYLHILMPHINSDGISCKIIIDDIIAYCRKQDISESGRQFVDFKRHFHTYMHSEQFNIDRKFWLDQQLNKGGNMLFNNKSAIPANKDFAGEAAVTPFPATLSYSIDNALKQMEGITKFQFLLSAYKLLLCQITGAGEINVVIPVHNRNQSGFDKIIGLLANTVIVKFPSDDTGTLSDFLQRNKRILMQVMAHQQYPYEFVTDDYRKTGVRGPLHQTYFNYNNFMEHYRLPASEWRLYLYAKHKEMLPLSMEVYEVNGEMTARMLSAKGYFSKNELDELTQTYFQLLEKMMDAADLPVKSFYEHNEQPYI